VKRRLLSLLNRLGLLLPAYRAYEALRAVRGRGRPAETRYAGFYPRDEYEEALMTFGPLVADVTALKYFRVTSGSIAGVPVDISRTCAAARPTC